MDFFKYIETNGASHYGQWIHIVLANVLFWVLVITLLIA